MLGGPQLPMNRRTVLATLFAALLAADAHAAGNGSSIQSIVESGRHPKLNRPDFGTYRGEVRKAYESNGYQPLWLSEGRPTPQANEVIDSLRAARVTGLLPADYDAGWLDAERIRLNTKGEVSAAFDTGLTISLIRFISDSYRGRVDPRAAGFEVDYQRKSLDLGHSTMELAHSESPAMRLTAFEPPFRVYDGLKAALERMRRLAAGKDLPEIPSMPVLRPGESDPGVPSVRKYLQILGYLDGTAAAPEGAELYDAVLVEAVERFQRRYGLEGDGVLGKQTQRQMRVPLTYRVKQIELAMERLRWLPYEYPKRFILVNLPEFRLRGFNSRDEPPAVSMGVVVGSAAGDTETPVLYADMLYVIFHPFWNVPSSIAEKELLPSMRRNARYAAKHNYQIVSGHGDEAQVLAPTAETLDLLANGEARLRQEPGPDNALGLVKFIFPNPSHVYLHDTPMKALFLRSRRDFSHGCIRVEDPVALARFVLGDDWSEKRIMDAMSGPENRRVRLPSPVQVLLYYTTAVVEEDGEVYFFDDIYGHDAKLAQLIAKGYRFGS
jgi:L,D-transpeptidase YcbB